MPPAAYAPPWADPHNGAPATGGAFRPVPFSGPHPNQGGPEGFGPGGFGPEGFGPEGFGPGRFGPERFGPDEYVPERHVPEGPVPGGFPGGPDGLSPNVTTFADPAQPPIPPAAQPPFAPAEQGPFTPFPAPGGDTVRAPFAPQAGPGHDHADPGQMNPGFGDPGFAGPGYRDRAHPDQHYPDPRSAGPRQSAPMPRPGAAPVPPYQGVPGHAAFHPTAPPTGVPPAGFGPGATGTEHVIYPAPQTDSHPIDDVTLVRRDFRTPPKGWRRAVYKMSGGTIKPRTPRSEIHRGELVAAINQPLAGDYRIAVLSLKGGVGKTTTTVTLGATLASVRGDRVIAVDANPDLGTLAQRVQRQTDSTVRDLLADGDLTRYSDVRAHTSQAPSRLEVLASERDPSVSEAFSDDEYRSVLSVLQRFYNIIITDCGTGLSHSVMKGVLETADSIIVVTSPAIDGARSAASTLDWLDAHGFGRLVSSAIVVISSPRPGSSNIDTAPLTQYFSSRCRAIEHIGFDDHLAEGAEVDLDRVSKPVKLAFMELAAIVAADFPNARHR
ncbi:AAA family ATPase [Gordonia pseudamarae]|nr:AAA family ATPase [Gordonia pseudamarae]